MNLEEIEVRVRGFVVAYVLEDDAREMIRNDGYTMVRKGHRRFLKLRDESNPQNVAKVRALCNSSTRAALSTTQREELYQGFRKPGRGEISTAGPVTATLTVVRKYRDGVGFIDWGEKERFTRKRFNPDRIPAAQFRNMAEYQAAQAGA